uniref:PX domain-containing protein n=1 Tax=Salarias fasciatus TaxID=181472 RepID=A0A672G4L6_SALFA
MMEEEKEVGSALSVHCHNIKITEVLRDGDTFTFLIVSQKLSGTGEYHVHRTYDDFDWLQQHLFSQQDVPGIQGVIFPPLPAKFQVNTSAKAMKQLGFLALGDFRPYCKALETFLCQVAAHSILSKNKAVEVFLTNSDPPGTHKKGKNIFNRLSQAVEEMRKESHKVRCALLHTDPLCLKTHGGEDFRFVSAGRGRVLSECSRSESDPNRLHEDRRRGEARLLVQFSVPFTHSNTVSILSPFLQKFLDVVLTEESKETAPLFHSFVYAWNDRYQPLLSLSLFAEIAVACGHFSTALHLCVESGDDPDKQAFTRICVKLSEVFESMKKNMASVAENDVITLGVGLDLECRFQEAEKVFLYFYFFWGLFGCFFFSNLHHQFMLILYE